MPETSRIICPRCGAEMNHHAEKLNTAATLDEPEEMDPDLEGVLEEIHTCPRCGTIVARRPTSSKAQ